VTRAVCRNCWTWYSKGETACPHCHIQLTSADAGARSSGVDAPVAPVPPIVRTAPAALGQPRADAPFPGPSEQGSSTLPWWQWWLIGRAAFAVLLVGTAVVSGLFLTGVFGPIKSSDGAFSVKVPAGWAVGQAPPTGTGKPVLALARLKTTAGVESHFIVGNPGQFVPLAKIEEAWQPYVESGKFPVAGTLSSVTHTTVAGAPALTVDFQGSKYAGQILFVDYGTTTYIIEMSADPGEFPKLRDTDFAAILNSWEWH
jgi:hypothetical protein